MSQPELTYLNTAAAGLLSKSSLAATHSFYDALQVNASARSEEWRFKEWPQIRETLAAFMDAPVSNVAFVPNFSYALTALVHSMTGKERVLLYNNDYPSVLDAFRLNNFNITWIDNEDGFHISSDKLKDTLLSKKIDLLVISHVQWLSGFKLDINDMAAFCRQHNIVFIVDATQSLGSVRLSARELDADAIIASNYKWMNAGFGSGVMYLGDRFLERFTPKIGGMGSYTMQGDKMFYEPSVRSFEPGHLNMAGLLLLNGAMKEKLEKGLDKIEMHNRKLTNQLLEAMVTMPVKLLGPADTIDRSSIVIIKDENGLGKYLADDSIIVTHRAGNLRVSMHFYNTEAEVQRLIACLQRFYSQGNT
ncbi:aminotransferase class V-fold PLP-dependent enzyme [Polluticoccus soli]|uniref:aminotransferase class V-fold PLP-dependent enzyme n=1 Tax=Polluticoccus soli TaxID=3034150 RepID=UPI0023E21AF7|nr:aminotransferase class V-fold PLP-dependent enzyme [Flavipsychrobacter sp. JY13-12]